MSTRLPRILLVEDEPSIADPFARSLRRAGFAVLTARTAAEALQLAGRRAPDLVVLDLGLPDEDGLAVVGRLRTGRDVPILVLTARGGEGDRIAGLELGADDYVVKPFSSAEVIARIRAVLRRTTGEPAPGPLAAGDIRVDPGARRAWRGGAELELTRKEFDLLERLVRDAGSVVTREALMADVWDENWFGSTKTLDVHVAWLRRKLGAEPGEAGPIATVRGVGFRLEA